MGLVVEAQRRKVFRVAAAYLVVGWLVIQVAATVLPQFDLPAWAPRMVTLLVALGFPIALVMAWVLDLTPEGIRVDASSAGSKRLLSLAAALVALALGWYFHDLTGARPVAPTHVAATPASASDAIPSIAVLPFLDMSQAHDQEYFSDGLSEELLNLLAQLPQLRVIARTSSFSFKDKEVDVATIAKALNVANVLEGSVRKSGNTLRITAQLIRASDSSHLWSQTYDRQLTDVFKVQDEIAAAVVAALKIRLLPTQSMANRPRSASPEAHDQFLIGRQFSTRGNEENWQRALAAYQRAIALDPGYAAAYAALASTQGVLADAHGDAAAMQASLHTADTAVRLAPTLPDGYVSRSFLRTFHQDWRGAEADVDKALALDPGDSTVQMAQSRLMIVLGRLPEAIDAARKGAQLDPLSTRAWSDLGRALNAAHQLPQAREALDHALEISPDSNYVLFHFGETALLEGKPQEALAAFARSGSGYGQPGIAMAQYSLGHAGQSRQALDAAIGQHARSAAYQIAQAYAWRDEPDQAFQWLDRAYAQHDSGLSFIKCDPLLANLRGDPRYQALLEKLDLPA